MIAIDGSGRIQENRAQPPDCARGENDSPDQYTHLGTTLSLPPLRSTLGKLSRSVFQTALRFVQIVKANLPQSANVTFDHTCRVEFSNFSLIVE